MDIRDSTIKFQGNKLKSARISRGLTLEDLSKKLNVSHQAVSKYENNKANPDGETIKIIANLLQYSPSFFYSRNQVLNEPHSPHFFRSGAAVPKKYKDQVKEKVRILALLIDFIQTKINLPKFKIPKFAKLSKEFRQIDFEEIDELTQSLRREIGLENGPINNMTALCERLGIIIAFSQMDNEKIDACTVWYDNRPYILLNESRISSVRLRFNIAHELGHIYLHSNYFEKDINDTSKNKRIEQEANRFASTFLMPESSIVQELSASGLDYLLVLKEHWKVSIQAIIYRAEELNVFSVDYTLYLRQQISRKKWRLNEPLDDVIPIERPRLIEQAIQFLFYKHNYSLEQLEFDTGLVSKELAMLGEIRLNDWENKKLNSNVVKFPKRSS